MRNCTTPSSSIKMIEGFSPVYDESSSILILGSFPSVKSRESSFYYGNRQNRFWVTLQKVFGGEIDTIEHKRDLCLGNGIALWDIVKRCVVVGSADASIKEYETVELDDVLSRAPIKKILCNGKLAYELTLSAYKGTLPVICLPSTSPANPRFDFGLWRAALEE